MARITVNLDITPELARAVAIRNGGRGEAGPYEIAMWADEAVGVAADELVQETRLRLEEAES